MELNGGSETGTRWRVALIKLQTLKKLLYGSRHKGMMSPELNQMFLLKLFAFELDARDSRARQIPVHIRPKLYRTDFQTDISNGKLASPLEFFRPTQMQR
jgi:hypothetical protein